MKDEIVAQLGTFGTFFSKPIILFCIFALSLWLMYVAFNYIEKGYRNKGLKIVFLSFFLGLLLGNVWTALNEQTLRIYAKKIDTLKSEISSMKQEALNKELREDELTKAQINYFEVYGRYASNISELISSGFLRADKVTDKPLKSLTSSLKDYQDEMLKSRNNYSYRGEK